MKNMNINGNEKEWLWRHSHSFIFACGDCAALAGYILGWRHPWNILLKLSYPPEAGTH